MSVHLQLEPAKMAEVVLNGEAFVQKAKNVVDHIETRLSETQADSEQSRNMKNLLTKDLEDIKTNITKKMSTVTSVTDEMRQKLEALENSDEIFASARAAMTESSAQGEVTLGQ